MIYHFNSNLHFELAIFHVSVHQSGLRSPKLNLKEVGGLSLIVYLHVIADFDFSFEFVDAILNAFSQLDFPKILCGFFKLFYCLYFWLEICPQFDLIFRPASTPFSSLKHQSLIVINSVITFLPPLSSIGRTKD